MSTTLSTQRRLKHTERRRRENAAVQRALLVFPLISIHSSRARGSELAVSARPEHVKRSATAQTLRKLCVPKRTASPQNSSTDILLSNPMAWPRPSRVSVRLFRCHGCSGKRSQARRLLKQDCCQDFTSTTHKSII